MAVIARIFLAAVLAALCAAGTAEAKVKWLCGPGVGDDPCRPGLSTTLYDGWGAELGAPPVRRDKARGVDCFYVYPTVSDQQTRLASKRADPEVRSIALYQAARFSQLCRVFAPVYRQATVPALNSGKTTRGDYLKAYGDVEEAFAAFVKRIGRKRGFVLLGHSQGAYHLQRLVRRRIDRKPGLRKRMVSAVLLGGNVTVRKGSDRGGAFRNVPTCRRPGQRSCVIAYSVFNETPPADAIFGRGESRVAGFLGLPKGRKLETACTNPVSLGRNSEVAFDTVAPSAPFAPGTLIAAGISLLGVQWPAPPTSFAEFAGAFTGRCSRAGGAHVLRVASAPGTPVPKPSPSPEWGLHLLDVNIAQADLVQTVRRQIRAYANL